MPLRRFLFAVIVAFAITARAAELRIGLAADVTSLDPHYLNVAPNNNAAWHVFDALVHVDANARLVPGLAVSWRAIDPTTWEFKLRKGVKFHDGSDFTAEDVIFSLERAATLAASPGPFASFVKPITAKKIVDPWTIRFKTAAPYAMLPYDLNSIFIVSKKAATGASTEDFNSGRAAVGTGPYKLVRFARGDRIELARNDAYWGGQNGKLAAWDKVTLRILPADTTRIAALLAGDLDAIENIPTADLIRLKANANFRLEQKVSWRTMLLHMDQYRDHPPHLSDKSGKPLPKNPFKDARVRLAVSKAINRRAIVERVMEGYAIAAGNLVSPPVFGYVDALKPEIYDPETAKKLLAEAGVTTPLEVSLKLPPPPYARQGGEVLAAQLAKAGIIAKIENLEWAQWLSSVFAGPHNYDLTIVSHVEPFDLVKYTEDNYYIGYKSDAFNAIYKSITEAANEADRAKLLGDAQRMLATDAAAGFLFQPQWITISSKKLKGVWGQVPQFANDFSDWAWE